MKSRNNPQRRNALIWTGIALVGVIIIFLPGIIGMDGFKGGFALSFGGGFVVMVGLIAAVIFFNLAKTLDHITQKENILAHWRYSPEEWKKYTELEHQEDAGGRKALFILIAIITVIVGIILWIIIRDNPLIIFLICLGIIAITGFTAWISAVTNHRNNKRNLGEVSIALDGVYLNRQLHVWKGIGNRLEEIAFENEYREQPRIRVKYSGPNRGGRSHYTARIPVPAGQEEVARRIVESISARHLKNSIS